MSESDPNQMKKICAEAAEHGRRVAEFDARIRTVAASLRVEAEAEFAATQALHDQLADVQLRLEPVTESLRAGDERSSTPTTHNRSRRQSVVIGLGAMLAAPRGQPAP